MQLAARSYLAAGVALVGASAIAVTPVAPTLPEVHAPVALTAAIDNPVTVFAPVATATQELISSVIERQTSNPAPILRQLGANAVAGYQSFMSTPPAYLLAYALTDVVVGAQEFGPNLNNFGTVTLESLTALATILGDMGEGLPAMLEAAGAQLAAGNPNGAIDAIMLAGLQPGVDLLMKVLTPEMNAIGQLLRVPQPITDAVTNAVIGVALGAIASTVGIGFDLGDPQPVVKGFIAGVQTVLDGAASGDPATFVNSIQHGVAKFALDVIGQAGQMQDSINYAVDGFVDALKQIAPKPFTPPDITLPTAKALAAPAPPRSQSRRCRPKSLNRLQSPTRAMLLAPQRIPPRRTPTQPQPPRLRAPRPKLQQPMLRIPMLRMRTPAPRPSPSCRRRRHPRPPRDRQR
ncbi:hypothetical protein BN975_05688 [Mycolicibacterium farcinogenes]|uniref:hypothetical protein n=1 Tax=Mycolicibacterium farcinogenes TaxID=1802 RepID=UPI00045856D8|nr:hypothetical protein [Mycolicibacterium farcinogenes]CDP89825.1 hypothetical protein BN975_05688 [Mycolicibacterium farcinogenes]